MDAAVSQEKGPVASHRLLERLTARLLQWFRQEKSNRHHADQAEILESWVERIAGQQRGVKHHSPESAEIDHPDVDYDARTRAFYERLGFAFVLTTNHGPKGPSTDPLAWYLKTLSP